MSSRNCRYCISRRARMPGASGQQLARGHLADHEEARYERDAKPGAGRLDEHREQLVARAAHRIDVLQPGHRKPLDDLQITGASATDSDNDGLLDAWEIDHFGDLSHTADGDDDGDGTTNQAEYIAGTDPADATSVFHVLSAQPTTKSTVLLRWTAVSGRLYNIYWTSDLTQGFSCIATGVESPQGTYTHTFKSAPSSGYYKITVQAPE
jgi:hypothetical protein